MHAENDFQGNCFHYFKNLHSSLKKNSPVQNIFRFSLFLNELTNQVLIYCGKLFPVGLMGPFISWAGYFATGINQYNYQKQKGSNAIIFGWSWRTDAFPSRYWSSLCPESDLWYSSYCPGVLIILTVRGLQNWFHQCCDPTATNSASEIFYRLTFGERGDF